MKYSVVIPIYNEEENIPLLHARLTTVMSGLGESYEIIMVNDGSADSSLELLEEIAKGDKCLKVVNFARNFGHQIAITAGLNHSSGDAVIVMDGDLQDPPEVLPQFINKWKEGYEVVYAIRRKRKENIFKRTAYFSFYRIMKKLSYLDIPLDSGDFSIIDRKVVDQLKNMPEKNRFVRGLRTWIGYRQIGLEYERDERNAGTPKFTLSKLMQLAFDGLVSFSYTPLRLATNLGFCTTGVAFVAALFYVIKKLIVGTEEVAGFPTLIVAVLFLGGIQLLTIGILGEYVGRIHEEVKGRPLYIVGSKVNFDDDE